MKSNLGLVLIIAILGCYSTPQDTVKAGAPQQDTAGKFYAGEILLPDMVHDDTLIVRDANYLNETLEQYGPGTDAQIWELLHETCDIKGAHKCKYITCPYVGYKTFTGTCGAQGCKPGDNYYKLDSIHFTHPEYSYDQCEAELFN